MPTATRKRHPESEISSWSQLIHRPVSVASNRTTGSRGHHAIVSKKFEHSFFVVLLLAFFTFAGNPQRLVADTGVVPSYQPESEQPAAPVNRCRPLPSGETVAPPRKNPSVPVIGAGDLLKVSVLGVPESDQEVRVGADGNIFLNFIGAVKVAGQTTEQAQATIAKKLVAGGFFTRSPGFSLCQRICHPGSLGDGRSAEAGSLSHAGRAHPV